MKTRTTFAALLMSLVFVISALPACAADADESSSPRLRIVPNDGAVTPSTGLYVYDPSGNVVAIGGSSYVYDPMGRLRTAEVDRFGNVQSQTYTYDVYGNRTGDGVTSYNVSESTNRLTTQGAQYDTAGNLTQWQPPYSAAARTYNYDALNTLMMEKVAVADGEEYIAHIYTADDERYWSFQGGASSVAVSRYSLRDLDGRVLREFSEPTANDWSARDYIYRDGLLLASHDTRTGATYHYSLDHLGTPRVVTNANHEKVGEHTYFPFGAEYTDDSPTDGRLHFTGHEQRDADLLGQNRGELDYMHARYYSETAGRFASVDPIWGDIGNPQTFNRYSYVANNPSNVVDPFGLQAIDLSFSASAEEFREMEAVVTLAGSGQSWSEFFFGGVLTQIAALGSGIASVKNPVTGLTAGEHWRATGYGLMAFADGVVPFGDPLADYYEGGPVDGTGYSRGIGEVTRDVEIAIIAGGYAAAARSRDVVTVSRWGRPGLKSGDWVMRGPANRWNYFWSGKWQPGMGNRFASFSSGQQFSVLKSTLRWPAGWGVDGWIKGLLGQRIYLP